MSKQLNVSLAFTANTSEAIAQIKNLQKELNNISMGKFGANAPIKSLTPEIQTAMKAASQLQAALEGAVNVQTGKLDLGKFSQSLNANQMKLSDYARQLSALGPTGNKAFLQLANSISQAEMPLMRSNGLLKQLGTTLANTARWQLSSSLLHGFIGSIQKAYGYSKDLNESLNNIRIVTGQNIDQMAKFAEQANKAARALNTTTTAYTDASLIFYQQGLNEAEVAKRTETTIKMANVTGQSVETISNQLTAVWNNFDNGTQSLEYYADVMTALGAATASSTDEIADGLNKFAAVAETVGLSYEYAASALATVTATTRQSADVVGTAFKTLFARIQDLELGKTLDDGTTLGTYSQALEKVGINIKDTSGEMKRMDVILDEMAAKWNTLGQAEQTALAQNVAGVRQYTQLIALMENWAFMQDNLKTSYNAEGTLNSQAEIYGESWEAASKKVRASLEKIYSTLLDDEFFIDLAHFTADLLDTIGNIIDAFGGVKGILLTIGSLLTKIFHDEMVKGMNNLAMGVKRLTPTGRQSEQRMKNEAWNAAAQLHSSATGNEYEAEQGALSQEVSLQRKLLENASNLSEEEIKQFQIRMDSVRAIQEQAKEQAKVADASKKSLEQLKDEMRIRAKLKASTKAITSTKEKIMSEISSDRGSVEAKNLAEQNALRAKREAEIRARAESELRSKTPKTQQVGTQFAQQLQSAGDAAVQASAEAINQEIQELAAKQAADYEAVLAQRMEQAKGRIEAAAQEASKQAGADVDSHTQVMTDLGTTKGIGKRLASSSSQQTTKNMGVQDTKAAAQSAIKDIQQLKKQIDSLKGKGINILDDKEIKELEQLEKTLQKLLDDPLTDAEKLKAVLAEIANTATDVNMATDNAIVASAADAEANSSVQMDSADYVAIAQGAEAAEASQSKFNNTMAAGKQMAQDLGNNIEGAGSRMLGLADKIAYGSQVAMSFGMALSSLKGMIDTAFNPDISGWEKAISIMTTLGMMVPMLMSAFEAYTKIFQKNTVAAGANAVAQGLSAGATKTMTGATAAQTPVAAANAAAWWAHPIIAIIAAACLVAVAAFSIFSNIVAQNSERIAENAKQARESAEAMREQADASADLMTQYKQALSTYEKTGENEQELIDITTKLTDAYDIQGGALAALTGDYEQLTKSLQEARKAELELLYAENERAIKASAQEAINKMDSAIGSVDSSGIYSGTHGYGASAQDEDKYTRGAVRAGDYQYLSEKDGMITFSADTTDPAQVLALIKELKDLQNEARNRAIDAGDQIGNSELYSSITEQLKELEELYPEFADLIAQQEEIQMELAAYEVGLFDAKTVTEFDAAMAQLKNQFDEKSLAKFVAKYGELTKLSQESTGFAEKFNPDSDNLDDIKAYYDTLDEAGQNIFWTIDFDYDANLDNVKTAMAEMQEYIDSVNLSTEINIKSGMENLLETALKSGTEEDWTAFKTAYEKAGYSKSFDDFIRMTNEEKFNYINTDYFDATAGIVTEEEYEAARGTAEQVEADVANAQTRVTELEGLIETERDKIATAEANITARKTGDAKASKQRLSGQYIIDNSMYADSGYTGINYDQTTYRPYKSDLFGYVLTPNDSNENVFMGAVHEDPTKAVIGNRDWNTGFENMQYRMETAGQTGGQYAKLYNWFGQIATGEGSIPDGMLSEIMSLADKWDINITEDAVTDMLTGWGDGHTKQDFANLDKLIQLLGESYGVDLGIKDFYGSDQTTIDNSNKLITETYQPELDAKNNFINENSAETIAGHYQTAAQLEYQAQEGLKQTAQYYGLNAEELQAYIDLLDHQYGPELEEQYETTTEYQQALHDIAVANKRLEKGAKALSSNWEDWNDIMSDSNATIEDVSSILPEVNEAVQDVLNLSDEEFELLPPDFAQKNWSLIKDVVDGVEGAVDVLRNKAGEEILLNVGVDVDVDKDGKLDAAIADLHNKIAGFDSTKFTVGVEIDPADYADFFTACNEMIAKAGMTAAEAQTYFKSMGYDAEVEEITVPPDVHPWAIENPVLDEAATALAGVPVFSGTETIEGENLNGGGTALAVKTITPNGSYGGGVGVNTTSPKSSTSGGGGGSKPKKADKVKKSDVVERYKEINDALKETAHLMNKTNAEAEGLWGKARFDKMRQGVELLKQENQQLKERMQWSKNYVDEDRISLNAAAAEAGISFQYDPEDGYITNYTEQMTWLYNQLDNAINNANADGNATEEEQEEINKWQKYIDDIESARGDYEDALAQWREDEEKWLENRNKIWQDNFDILSEELELEVQLNTQDLEVLQYFLDKIEDAVYGIAEAFASGQYFQQQFANYSANLGLLSNETGDPKTQGFYQNLQDQYRNGDIGLPQYKQGLADMMGMTIENLESLQDLKESMQDFYGDVMEKALEEIAIYTDSMENLNSVLDHYSNILELVGKQDDYASKNKVLSSKAKNLRNEIDVQKRLYEESAADAEYWAQKMNEAEVDSNEYETYKKNWQAAEAAAQESQDAMLSKTQEWAEAMKSIIENELAEFADILEKSLTGGVSFDELMTSMERRSSLQEEYLTTTNKIYETNKLMRTAQQEIDKTSNTAAKRRMAQFISETQQLQNKNKLSQYELEIQQAKYDLLLAEIALEEAQDAKSIVRLQRDAEGNFGYVYTADQNAVADAEQQLADAQNNLYNIGLEGANNYQQKYAETLQESQEAITELTQMWMNGEISSEEEFNRRKQEIVEYYGEKLQQYSDLHSIALTTDSRVVKDAWSSDFTSMTASVDVWKQNVDTYFSQAGESMKDWADVCSQTLEDSGLDDMDKTLGDIDQKSKDLKNTLIGEDGKSGVVAAMMAEVDAAGKLSEEYISIQDAIDGVITEYEELLKILNEDYQSPNGPGDEEGKQNGNENDGEEENNENNQNDDNNETPPPAAELSVGSTVKVKTSASKWASGEGIWGPVKGNNFKVMQISGEKVLIGDPCGPNYTASGVTGWIKKTDLEGFDTGGYTGDWSGAYGKLALLHKKELILKEGDTANFLAGMDLLNKIISVIDLQSVNNSLGGLLSSPSLGHVGDEGGILEQQVHIEASFPGVSDHSEIEEAFNNLVNQAAQYANRK